MKIVIDIPEMAYEAYKEWHKNKVATVEQSLIATGKPYQDPLFKSVPTYRNYSDYHDAEQYTRGWNDAMRFIFGIEENRVVSNSFITERPQGGEE